MFKKLSSSLLIVSACVFSSCTPTVKQEIAILPTPVSLTEQSGSFVLKDGMFKNMLKISQVNLNDPKEREAVLKLEGFSELLINGLQNDVDYFLNAANSF